MRYGVAILLSSVYAMGESAVLWQYLRNPTEMMSHIAAGSFIFGTLIYYAMMITFSNRPSP